MDNDTLQAIGQMLDEKLMAEREVTRRMIQQEINPIREKLDVIQEQEINPIREKLDVIQEQELKTIHEKLDVIQENVEVNRHTGNLLLKWAEKAERSVNVGLYE